MAVETSKCKSCGQMKVKEFLKLSRCSKIYCDGKGRRWVGLVCPSCARKLAAESALRVKRRKQLEEERAARANKEPYKYVKAPLGPEKPEFVTYRACARCGEQMANRYFLCVNCRPVLPTEDPIWERA